MGFRRRWPRLGRWPSWRGGGKIGIYSCLEGLTSTQSVISCVSSPTSKISLRVQWRNGSAILTKVRDRRECCLQLKQQQQMLRVLLEREMALLAGSLQGNGMAAWEEGQGTYSQDGVVDDVISVVHAAVATLRADYFVLPTLPFLLFTYSSGDAGQESFIRGRHVV